MTQSFQLKGRLFTLSVLQLSNPDCDVLEKGLADKIAQAPKFFANAPVVIDLARINFKKYNLDFARLHQLLRTHGLVPVGVRGASATIQQEAVEAGFAVMTESEEMQAAAKVKCVATESTTDVVAPEQSLVAGKPRAKRAASLVSKPGSKLITQPIRSGQQVYVEGGDLVVIAPVSPGAELLAEGNIHVYGTLRGRALAGVNGDEKARIFCHKLEAELVSIAGSYKLFEDIDSAKMSAGFKQLYLKNGQLLIDSL